MTDLERANVILSDALINLRHALAHDRPTPAQLKGYIDATLTAATALSGGLQPDSQLKALLDEMLKNAGWAR